MTKAFNCLLILAENADTDFNYSKTLIKCDVNIKLIEGMMKK